MDTLKGRKFLGIKFNCCNVYYRIYVNRQGTHYEGRCPKCGQPVKVRIDPTAGTNTRFFETK
ncbi:MAG: hypothetical protein HQK55_12960 [Deltaproteobacteria bacterium]|nr:hypothetical protein [Deltaproteobacteria bacterium]